MKEISLGKVENKIVREFLKGFKEPPYRAEVAMRMDALRNAITKPFTNLIEKDILIRSNVSRKDKRNVVAKCFELNPEMGIGHFREMSRSYFKEVKLEKKIFFFNSEFTQTFLSGDNGNRFIDWINEFHEIDLDKSDYWKILMLCKMYPAILEICLFPNGAGPENNGHHHEELATSRKDKNLSRRLFRIRLISILVQSLSKEKIPIPSIISRTNMAVRISISLDKPIPITYADGKVHKFKSIDLSGSLALNFSKKQ